MDAGSFASGALFGTAVMAIIDYVGRDRRLERPGPTQADIAADQERWCRQEFGHPNIFYSPADQIALQELERQRLANSYSAWQAAQQQSWHFQAAPCMTSEDGIISKIPMR